MSSTSNILGDERAVRTTNARPKTPHQHATELMDVAREAEKSKRASERTLVKLAIGASVGFFAIAAGAVVAVAALAPLKRVEDRLVFLDGSTGAPQVIETLVDAKTTYGEQSDKYWLSRYVTFREGYDWVTLQSMYDATIDLSDDRVADEYRAIYNGDKAPHKVLQNSARVLVKVNSITFIGETAQVRFEKRFFPNDGSLDPKPSVTKWIATVAFKYVGAPATEAQRQINPLGWKARSYRVDSEALQ